MMVANSTWVRPAQALIYSESGEVQYFPPRNKGRLPRALTFGDHEDYRHHAAAQHRVHAEVEPHHVIPFQFSEQLQEQDSLLITSGSENFPMEDPPDEYASFESEYSKNSIRSMVEQDPHMCSYMDLEAPLMSTPNEQYIHNVMKRKVSSKSPLSQNQQPYMSSFAESENGCFSPLLQPDPNQCLPLSDLVDLYSKKYAAAMSARATKVDLSSSDSSESDESTNKSEEKRKDEQEVSDLSNAMERMCDRGNQLDCTQEEHNNLERNSRDKNAINSCNALQLMAFDIQLFLQKLDDISTDQEKKTHYQDWLCITTEELELLLLNCCKETMQFVMME